MSNANDQIPPLFFRPRYAMNTLENFTNTQLVKHYSRAKFIGKLDRGINEIRKDATLKVKNKKKINVTNDFLVRFPFNTETSLIVTENLKY